MRRVPRGKDDAGMLVYEDPHVLNMIKAFLSTDDARLEIVVEEDIVVKENVNVDGEEVDVHPLVRAIQSLKDDDRLRGVCEIRKADSERADLDA